MQVAVLLAAAGLLACSTPFKISGHSDAGVRRMRILQVNDTYKIEGLERGTSGGFARLRTLRRQLESDGGPVLLLHAGDFLYPSVMSKYLAAEPMVRVMNLLDGDPAAFDPYMIVTFGNHEFDNPDPGVLLGRIAQSDFAWVSTNVSYRSNPGAAPQAWNRRAQVLPQILRTVNDIRVGVFALTLDVAETDYVSYRYSPKERREIVRGAIDALKQEGAEVIVALTHQDLEQDEWLAREFPEIHLIAGGHEHFFIQEQEGGTWITKADADNQSAMVHDITMQAGAPPVVTPRRVPLDQSVAEDPKVRAETDRWLDRLSAAIKKATGRDSTQVIAQTLHPLEGLETAIRSRETALGNFLADTVRQRMGTDVAFINGGGIRINDNIPPGPVTVADLEGLFYFDDTLVSFQITGQELLDLLHESVASVHLGHGRFLQVAGLRFSYHRSGSARAPLYHVEPSEVWVRRAKDADYKPLDLNARYSAASTDFLWNRGYTDGYGLFRRGAGGSSPPRLNAEPPPDFRRVTEQQLARLPAHTITSHIDGRIEALISAP